MELDTHTLSMEMVGKTRHQTRPSQVLEVALSPQVATVTVPSSLMERKTRGREYQNLQAFLNQVFFETQQVQLY